MKGRNKGDKKDERDINAGTAAGLDPVQHCFYCIADPLPAKPGFTVLT